MRMEEAAIAKLRDERDYWKEYARQLETALSEIEQLPEVLRNALSPYCVKLVGALYQRQWCSYESLYLVLWGDRDWPSNHQATLRCQLCKSRQQLRPYGIRLATIRAQGVAMPTRSKARINVLRVAEARGGAA